MFPFQVDGIKTEMKTKWQKTKATIYTDKNRSDEIKATDE